LRPRRSGDTVELPATRLGSDGPAPRFFFYFDDEEASRSSAAELEAKGYSKEITAPDTEVEQWQVVAFGVPETDDLEGSERIFAKWAESRSGDYDGHELALVEDATAARPAAGVTVEADATRVMRHSDDTVWASLRHSLGQEAIDPESTRLVASFEEPTVLREPPTAPTDFDLQEVVVLVTADGRVLEFAYSNRRQAWVAWDDITDSWREGRHAEKIESALMSREGRSH
jgi:hypothetical protein